MKNKVLVCATNMYGVRVKRCCGSCQHRCILKDGERMCANAMVIVEQKFCCSQWLMSDGLKNAGMGGGVVRLKGTTEILIK